MEKRPPKVKSTFMKLLPRAASPVIFLHSPTTPAGDRRSQAVSIVPPEARRKSRSWSFDTREPTSPKVSCMGHINNKKKNCNNKIKLVLPPKEQSNPVPGKLKKNPFFIYKIFQGSNNRRKKSGSTDDKQPGVDRAPCLTQMKRFASGRDEFMNFDWRVLAIAVAPDNQNHSSDHDKKEDQEKTILPFSAPIEPKKEIDLWKRRAVRPPPRLQLKKK